MTNEHESLHLLTISARKRTTVSFPCLPEISQYWSRVKYWINVETSNLWVKWGTLQSVFHRWDPPSWATLPPIAIVHKCDYIACRILFIIHTLLSTWWAADPVHTSAATAIKFCLPVLQNADFQICQIPLHWMKLPLLSNCWHEIIAQFCWSQYTVIQVLHPEKNAHNYIIATNCLGAWGFAGGWSVHLRSSHLLLLSSLNIVCRSIWHNSDQPPTCI